MNKQMELLQGTLDMLILKAVSLGPLHGYGVLLRIQQISKDRLEVRKIRCIPRCIAWNIRAGSPANGANRKTSTKRNTTGSRPRAGANCKRKRISGTAWRT